MDANDKKRDLDHQRLLSETEKNKFEALKFENEALEIQKRLNQKWYSARILVQTFVAGIVVAALLAGWAIGVLKPMFDAQRELTKMEVREIKLNTQIQQAKNEILRADLADRNERLKESYIAMAKQNDELAVQVSELTKSAEAQLAEMESELENTNAKYAALAVTTADERQVHELLVSAATDRIASLNSEIEGLTKAKDEINARSNVILWERVISHTQIDPWVVSEPERSLLDDLLDHIDEFGISGQITTPPVPVE